MPELLLVEDDPALGDTLCTRLKSEGFSVSWAKSLKDALEINDTSQHDLAVVDIGLPDGDGFHFIRQMKNKMPFIFLTAMNSAEFRLEGFELGAEDYVPKPFHFKELLLRLKRVVEKYNISSEITCCHCTLETNKRVITYPDKKTEQLSPTEFTILKMLLGNSPKVVSRKEIAKKLWGDKPHKNTRTIDNAILKLRHVFAKTNQEPIRSVRGLGYLFEDLC